MKKILFIDILCFSSLIKILFLKEKITKVYYLNETKHISFLKRIIEKKKLISFIQLNFIAYSDEKIGNINLYEDIWQEINKVRDTIVDKIAMKQQVELFCKKYRYNSLKFYEHLKESFLPLLYKVIELKKNAQSLLQEDETPVFLLRKTLVSRFILDVLGENTVYFYKSNASYLRDIIPRSEYGFDMFFRPNQFFTNKITIFFSFITYRIFYFICDLISSIISLFFSFFKRQQYIIGVENYHNKINFSEINDVYWIKSAGIDPEEMCIMEEGITNEHNRNVLDNEKLRRVRSLSNPVKLLQSAFAKLTKKDSFDLISPGFLYLIRNAFYPLILFRFFFLNNEEAWLCYNQIMYKMKTEYWMAIYKKVGCKVVWSTSDIETNRIFKSQALELLGGYLLGSHFSNYPVYTVPQNFYDIFFVWGRYFRDDLLKSAGYLKKFIVGYPNDHYYKDQIGDAKKLKEEYRDNIIITYMDNIILNDLPYTRLMQQKIYKLLISLLEEYSHLVLFLKPKRKRMIDNLLEEIPELKQLVEKKRIVVFTGKDFYTKANPVKIGMASDLVLGMGVSTAASECFFAGKIAFHAELSGLINNGFSNQAAGKIIFRDIEELKSAIKRRIEGTDTHSYSEYKKYYSMLDPFMDGKCSLRTGFIIKKIKDYIVEGKVRREQIPEVVEKDYNCFIGISEVSTNKKS